MMRRWREGEEREKKMMWKAVESKEGAFRLELSGNTVEWTVKAGFSRKRIDENRESKRSMRRR